jgi:hypothetical protein
MTRSLRPFALLLATLGCAPSLPAPDDQPQVVLALASVPAEVSCLRLTAAGAARSVVRELPVTEGAMVSESFSGLPLGPVVFTGDAFGADCESVTKSTIPGWASEPATVSIALGRLSTVSLTLNRNGRAKVNVEFNDDTADAGAAEVDAP